MIRWAIPTTIQFFFIFFAHKIGFWRFGEGLILTRSHISFLINMDLVIPNHTC